jgi:hypothetical protein
VGSLLLSRPFVGRRTSRTSHSHTPQLTSHQPRPTPAFFVFCVLFCVLRAAALRASSQTCDLYGASAPVERARSQEVSLGRPRVACSASQPAAERALSALDKEPLSPTQRERRKPGAAQVPSCVCYVVMLP